jgi:AraC-like DNA-binding protein
MIRICQFYFVHEGAACMLEQNLPITLSEKFTFELNLVGYNYIEDQRFIINRPSGSSDFLFLFFSTPVDIFSGECLTRSKSNALILYSPEHPHSYSNKTEGFTNDWFHFSSDYLSDHIETLGIPVNELFYIDSCAFVRDFIRDLELEYKLKEISYQENINAQLVSFFIRLKRAHQHQNQVRINPYLSNLKEDFRNIRSKMLTHYQYPWTTEKMASEVSLSRTRFCVLYKHFFDISPKEELLVERFKIAQHLLITTHLTIEEIATKVGYSNMYHFSKQFKRTLGLSPSSYRQQYVV